MDKDLDDMLEELIRGSSRVFVSEDPEDPFILIDRGSEGLVFIAPSLEEQFNIINIGLNMIASLEMVLQEALGEYVSRDAILTLGCGDSEYFYTHPWDIRRKGGRLYYGYEKAHYLLLISRIYWCLENWGYVSLILRSFTEKRDRRTGLPIKQIRGFLLRRYQKELRLERIPLDELIQANTIDPETGERIPPEPLVEYCYEHECVSSDDLR